MDRREGGIGDDGAGRRQPVDVRHPDVHHDHVGQQLPGELDRRRAVVGLTDDLDVVLGVEQHAQTGPEQHLVVGDDDANRGRVPRLRSW